MRSYDVAVTSLAIDAPAKWTDNVLSQHTVPGIISQTRGVARRIPYSSLVLLAITRRLHVGFGIGVATALALALDIVRNEPECAVSSGPFTLRLDLRALELELAHRISDALESAPQPRRGRPPLRRQT